MSSRTSAKTGDRINETFRDLVCRVYDADKAKTGAKAQRGTALTGGYGSTIGAGIGALIMAMAVQGIPSARWNSDWRFVFVGGILLLAVVANNYIRTKAESAR